MTWRPEDDCGPKKRCAATTREAILEAATRRFALEGYERAGAREIAADAGVTAALVNRYFGSKEGLFAEVIERAFNGHEMLAGGLEGLALRLARHVVDKAEEGGCAARAPLLLLLRSATEPRSAELLRENFDRKFIRPLAAMLPGPNAEIRAAIVAAHLTGFSTLDQMIRTEAFAGACRERLVALLAEAIDACLEPAAGRDDRAEIP